MRNAKHHLRRHWAIASVVVIVLAVNVWAGIKDAQIHQFPPADLAHRSIVLNVKTVGATASRDAIKFTVPEPWEIIAVRSTSRLLSGVITGFTMDVKRTAGSVTHTVLKTATDLYGSGLASAGTMHEATLCCGSYPVVFNTGDVMTVNYLMTGTDTPLATDVSWQLIYRPTVGYER